MYRISQISLAPGEPLENIPKKILKKIAVSGSNNRSGQKKRRGPVKSGHNPLTEFRGGAVTDAKTGDLRIKEWKIVRESIDARDKKNIKLVYTVDFDVFVPAKPEYIVKLNCEIAPDVKYEPVQTLKEAAELKHRPVIVGFGPAGMFAALTLAQAGYRPLILERGEDVDTRTLLVEKFWETGQLDTDCNVQFGEGGAGTFSDGKLTTGIKDPRITKVLNELVNAGGPEDILYKQKPHIGTDVLRTVVKTVREEIKTLGGEIRFNSLVSDFVERDGKLSAVVLADGEQIPCEAAVFAIGHSSRDTFRKLYEKNVKMNQKPFSIGVRIEHPQDMIDIGQYGKKACEIGLPVAEYKLNWRCENGRGVYTFCMCPGGQVVVASSQEGGVVTNGMSLHARNSGIANSALLCDVRTSDFGSEHVLAGVNFQEKYERLAYINGGGDYKPPKCTWGQLRDGKAPQVENSLPAFAVEALREAMPHLAHKLHGFDDENAVVTAVEARSSSPVRFERDSNTLEGMLICESGDMSGRIFSGFYPCGEGAGYAGGIMSAAVDGIRVAESIIKNYSKTL